MPWTAPSGSWRRPSTGRSLIGVPRLEPGDAAPGISLPDADGETVSLGDYSGRRVIVYFYPAASTPGCTTQACDFQDNVAALNRSGVDVLGVSPDVPQALARFRDEQGLSFALLSDPDHAVLQAYGAWGEKTLLRADECGRHPLDCGGSCGPDDRARSVQREGHRARRPAAARARRPRLGRPAGARHECTALRPQPPFGHARPGRQQHPARAATERRADAPPLGCRQAILGPRAGVA